MIISLIMIRNHQFKPAKKQEMKTRYYHFLFFIIISYVFIARFPQALICYIIFSNVQKLWHKNVQIIWKSLNILK